MLFAYTAEPGTPSEDGLKLLASWAATQELADPATSGEEILPPAPLRRIASRQGPTGGIVFRLGGTRASITDPWAVWLNSAR